MSTRRSATTSLVRGLHRQPGFAGAEETLASSVHWNALIAVADSLALAPALYLSLEASGRLRETPRGFRNALATDYRRNAQRNSAIGDQLSAIVGALNRSSIEPLLLRNAAVLIADRPSEAAAYRISELDLLVPVSRLEAAVNCLRALGYVLPRDRDHAPAVFVRDSAVATVRLHGELSEHAELLTAEEVWRRARRREIAGTGSCFIPGPTDRAFDHLLHAQLSPEGGFYRGRVDLYQIYVFDLLSRTAVDWIFIEDRFRRYGRLTPLYSYLLVAGALFGTPWPYDTPPPWQARAHARQCLAALHYPVLGWIGSPIGDLHAALRQRSPRTDPDTPGRQNLPRLLRRYPARFPFPRSFRF